MRIAFLNPQGNFDNLDSYLTEHPDFGGQLVYVKELAIAMSKKGVKTDIITRQIVDKNWIGFEEKIDYYEGIDGVRIIRIPFGGSKFLNKEKLWPYINEYVNGIIEFYKQEDDYPDFFTSHYGDGGIAGALIYDRLKIPFSFTGHSLGAQKMDKLHINLDNIKEVDEKYNFTLRIMAERISMANSAVNFVSTEQERFGQYSHVAYRGAIDVDEDSKFKVVTPGVNTELFNSQATLGEDEVIKDRVNKVFMRDIDSNRINLPSIVAASRLDPKKNHIGLVRAYGQNKELQDKCNLVITLRGIDNPFKDYSQAREEEKNILDQIMEHIKEYNLKGKVSMFSLNSQRELAACYREFARRNSVFCLTALYEPFGLAPIEAMACGLPAVVTKNGGPSEVLKEGDKDFGVLVDPTNEEDIAKGLLKVFKDIGTYKKYQQLGIERVQSKYTWDSTAYNYLKTIKEKLDEYKRGKTFKSLDIPNYFINPKDNDKISLEWLIKTYLEGDK